MDAPTVSLPTSTEPDLLKAAFHQLRKGYAGQRCPDIASRMARLDLLASMIRAHGNDLIAAINADFGNRSAHETRLMEIFPALSAIKEAKRDLPGWMRLRRSWASMWFLPARTEIRPQPLGVIGIIVPWNFPVLLAVSPLVGALAAGNRVMIKMSEFTPRTGELFAKLIAQTFPPDQVTVVNGGPDVAQAFSRLPFDHLLFTGSTAVGHHVMRAAAEHLTPVTLELGGKSPAIIGPECNINQAAAKIMFGKCLNAGQACIAPDYVLLPRGSESAFINAARSALVTMYPKLVGNGDYTSIINARHYERLQDYLVDAAARGATVIPLASGSEGLEIERKIIPTIIHQVNDEMRVMQEEIFGPLLPLVPYSTLDEAIAYVNAKPRPLALYYFGDNPAHTDTVLNQTVSGGVTINETLLHISQEHLPFGGVGPSGMGAYHGEQGFMTFSHMKPTFHQARFNGLGLFRPPYGKRFDTLLKLLMR